MGYGSGRRSSITEAFSLNPLPYRVLFILFVVFIFLAISWSISYESAVEDAEESFNWALMVTPVILLIAVRWLSSIPDSDTFFRSSPSAGYNRSRTNYLSSEAGGSSPWGVAALIILLLIMVSFHSTFRDMWLIP